MLNSMSKSACGLAVVLSFAGSSAFAEAHTIEIAEGAYLPIISYVQPGDDLVFTNESDFSHTVSGPAGSWTSGVIPPGGTFTLEISNDTAFTFSGAIDGLDMAGEFTFEPAPLDEASGG